MRLHPWFIVIILQFDDHLKLILWTLPPSLHGCNAAPAEEDFNQVLPLQPSNTHFHLPQSVPHYPAAQGRSPICSCMRAQTDAAGMAEQVWTYRSMLFWVSSKCALGSRSPEQSTSDQQGVGLQDQSQTPSYL